MCVVHLQLTHADVVTPTDAHGSPAVPGGFAADTAPWAIPLVTAERRAADGRLCRADSLHRIPVPEGGRG